jgi:cob(I)alamin adenosyltransferase
MPLPLSGYRSRYDCSLKITSYLQLITCFFNNVLVGDATSPYPQAAMGTKIYTRRGDAGQTDLTRGRRVSKGSINIELLGQLDELNAAIGLSRAAGVPPLVEDDIATIQDELLWLGAKVAEADGSTLDPINEASVARLENQIDTHEAMLSPLHSFVLPGGSTSGAQLHIARCICRRAERTLHRLEKNSDMTEIAAYLNRLSDLLFVLARRTNALAGMPEPTWVGRKTTQ